MIIQLSPLLAFVHDLDERRTHVLLLHAVDGALSNVLNQASTRFIIWFPKTAVDPCSDHAHPRPLRYLGRA